MILVNLTCGRNPWSRASTEDATFRAYSKDPFFLKTILPLTTEMVYILSRIFELDPTKRITIPDLRSMIVDCPRFTEVPMPPQYVANRQPQTLPQSLEEPLQTLTLSPENSAPETAERLLDHLRNIVAPSLLQSTAKDEDDVSIFQDEDDESIFQDVEDESTFQDGWH